MGQNVQIRSERGPPEAFGAGAASISPPMDATKAAAETRPARGARSEGTATADSSFGQGQRVLVDLSAFDGYLLWDRARHGVRI